RSHGGDGNHFRGRRGDGGFVGGGQRGGGRDARLHRAGGRVGALPGPHGGRIAPSRFPVPDVSGRSGRVRQFADVRGGDVDGGGAGAGRGQRPEAAGSVPPRGRALRGGYPSGAGDH